MAPDPAAGFALGIECTGEISSRAVLDSAEFGHQAPSSSGLTRGSFFVAMAEPADGKQDPRVEPEDDTVGGAGASPPPSRREDAAIHLPQSSTEGGKAPVVCLPMRSRGRWIDAKHRDGGGWLGGAQDEGY